MPLNVNGVRLLQIFLKDIQYPLQTAQEGNYYSLANYQRVLATLCKLSINCRFCRRVANTFDISLIVISGLLPQGSCRQRILDKL